MPSDSAGRLTVATVQAERPIASLEDDVRAGLLAPPRQLPPKYFYDARGAELFEQITRTPEYYPTRCEQRLLAEHGAAAMQAARPVHLIELGSGSSRKTRALLSGANAELAAYWPFDVSETMLVASARRLCVDYPTLSVHALVGDYTAGLGGVASRLPDAGSRLIAFLGGTIGNFSPAQVARFMGDVAGLMRSGDHLLLGVDRHKDTTVLERAYNDAAGITAEFNRNALRVLNSGIKANFDVEAFEHMAVYDDEQHQIEMYLIARKAQTVSLGTLRQRITLAGGERIRTEISRKFDTEGIHGLLAGAGLAVAEIWTTPEPETYSLVLAKKA